MDKPKQKTQPKGIDPETGKPYEPIEIPVIKRGEFEGALRRVAKGSGDSFPQSPGRDLEGNS